MTMWLLHTDCKNNLNERGSVIKVALLHFFNLRFIDVFNSVRSHEV